jgi:hypothetical protein
MTNLSEKMIQIAESLQRGDRAKAVREIPISEPTLKKYLEGEIIKLDVAEKIIKFFENEVH